MRRKALLALALLAASMLLAPTGHAGGTGTAPTHISYGGQTTGRAGRYMSLLAALHDSATNQGIPGQTLSFSIRTTFGSLPLGNATTDADGKAAVDYEPPEAGTFTLRIDYAGNGTYGPTNATASLAIGAGAVPPPGLSAEVVTVLIILAALGGVWGTYAYVVAQILGIRDNAPARSRWARARHVRSEARTMEPQTEGPKSVQAASMRPSRAPVVLGAAALVLAGLALAFVGASALTPRASGYTPTTTELQLTVVPDMRGAGWDSWVPGELVVHKGDDVKITVYNADTLPHGFHIAAFGVDVPIPGATLGANDTVIPSKTVVEFTATSSGDFLIECNAYCGDGHDTMTATLVVLPD